MNKALISALLLGVATASTITGWTYPSNAAGGDRFIITDENAATINGFLEFDFGYETHYVGGSPNSFITNWQSEGYGFDFYSHVLLNIDFQFFNMYENNMKYYFEPIMADPYTQTILW